VQPANLKQSAILGSLEAEVNRLRTVIAQRGVDQLAVVMEGIDQLLAQAARGDAGSIAALRRLDELLGRVAELRSRIALVRPPS
jgi:hypothetical protein